jgi:hypothetical protein
MFGFVTGRRRTTSPARKRQKDPQPNTGFNPSPKSKRHHPPPVGQSVSSAQGSGRRQSNIPSSPPIVDDGLLPQNGVRRRRRPNNVSSSKPRSRRKRHSSLPASDASRTSSTSRVHRHDSEQSPTNIPSPSASFSGNLSDQDAQVDSLPVPQSRFQLSKSRKSALRGMMPAVFAKRAAADLQLMKEEYRHGAKARELDQYGSGDEAPESSTSESEDPDPEPRQEEDAVSHWLGSFVPNRVQGRRKDSGRDFIDRLLLQAQKSNSRVKKKRKSKAREEDDDRTRPREGKGKRKATAPRHAPIRLDDDDTLFAQWSKDPPEPLAAANSTTAPSATIDWSRFDRFSYDFGLERLTDLSFGESSYITRGYLLDLVALLRDEPSLPRSYHRAYMAFGTLFDTDMGVERLLDVLPSFCDAVFESLAAVIHDENPDRPANQGAEGLRFLSGYLSNATGGELSRLAIAVNGQVSHLSKRLASLQSSDSKFTAAILPVQWSIFELTLRTHLLLGINSASLMLTASEPPTEVKEAAEVLVRRLLQRGVKAPMESLRSTTDAAQGSRELDVSVEIWTCLINVVLAGQRSPIPPASFWTMVFDATGDLENSQPNPILRSEVEAYTATLMSAVSQLSPVGRVGPPRMPAHWTIISQPLRLLTPEELANPPPTMSNTLLARRDSFISTLFARTLNFVDRWGWTIDQGIVTSLFDILNSRQLENLVTDTSNDFPDFIREYHGDVPTSLDATRDSAFHIFLKLVNLAARSLQSSSPVEKRRNLGRLLVRITPMRTITFQSDSSASLMGSRLINFCSLHMLGMILAPESANQRVSQLRSLLRFEDMPDAARRVQLRAIQSVCFIFRQLGLSSAPLVDWLASISTFLRAEYRRLQSEVIKAGAKENARAPEKQMWSVVLLMSMLLRSVGNVLESMSATTYPDLAFLHPCTWSYAERNIPADDTAAWTSDLMDSALALDPVVGHEILQYLEVFLRLRSSRMSSIRRPPPATEASQDEFDSIDPEFFNDPAFDQMLGGGAVGNGGVEDASRVSGPNEFAEDEKFAEVRRFPGTLCPLTLFNLTACAPIKIIRTRLSPAFYRLLSHLFSDDFSRARNDRRRTPIVQDRLGYVDSVLHCWVGALAVLVEHKNAVSCLCDERSRRIIYLTKKTLFRLQEWTEYMQWGVHSWKRLTDPVGRGEVGMRWLIHASSHAPHLLSVRLDDWLAR